MTQTIEMLAALFIGPLETIGGVPELKAYQDQAGVWTIGFGTTYANGAPIVAGEVWTAEQCETAFSEDLIKYVAEVVNLNTRHPWTLNQIVALTSLQYNIGVNAYRSSSVLKYHNNGQFAQAADAFLLWDKAHINGVLTTDAGLLNRRNIERSKYLSA